MLDEEDGVEPDVDYQDPELELEFELDVSFDVELEDSVELESAVSFLSSATVSFKGSRISKVKSAGYLLILFRSVM